jgi:hypothetical protein
MSETPLDQPEAREPLSANRGLWLMSNGPGVATVIGSAVVAILASVVHFTTEALLQIVLLPMALIGTSLVTERRAQRRDLLRIPEPRRLPLIHARRRRRTDRPRPPVPGPMRSAYVRRGPLHSVS